MKSILNALALLGIALESASEWLSDGASAGVGLAAKLVLVLLIINAVAIAIGEERNSTKKRNGKNDDADSSNDEE